MYLLPERLLPVQAPASEEHRYDYQAEGTEKDVTVYPEETVHCLLLYDIFPYNTFSERAVITHIQ